MILVTKCPHCQTAFRVTEDQLKLYDGVVRCGVCQQIFNGTNHLQTEPPVLTDKTAVIEKQKTPPAAEKSDAGKRPVTQPGQTPEKEPIATGKQALSPQKAAAAEKAPDDIAISLAEADISAASDGEVLFDALEEELSAISLELEQVTGQLFGNDPELPPHDEKIPSPEKPSVTINEIVSSGHEPHSPKPSIKAATTSFTTLSRSPDSTTPAKNTVYSTAPRLDDVAEIAPSTTIEAEIVEPDEHASALHRRNSQRLASRYQDVDPLMDNDDRHHAAFFEMAEEDHSDDDLYVSEPGFVKQGRKKKRRGRFSGAFLMLATLALLTALSVQCLYMFSDRIAVWWPPAEPAVAKACNLLSCPRRLETRISALSIESSELQTVALLTDKYALSVLIRNGGASYQSWPHIELTLTDRDKKPIMRRVFSPANYLPDAGRIIRGISPYSEESVKLYLEMKTEPHTDYRVSLFYP